jgi:hypothetical protein
VPPANKKARLVRERGDACTAVSRAEASLPREGVRVSMRTSKSVRVRLRVSCLFLRSRGGRCWVWITQGDAFQTSFVRMSDRGLVRNVCVDLQCLVDPRHMTVPSKWRSSTVPVGLTLTPGNDSSPRHERNPSADINQSAMGGFIVAVTCQRRFAFSW